MHNASLVWATLQGEDLLVKMARVSNPANEDNKATAPRLIRYLINHKHWSPFEMINMCVEIYTTRAIGRQLLRHRSFSFQEYSSRYAAANMIHHDDLSTARMQDYKNRQNSIPSTDDDLINWWRSQQNMQIVSALTAYQSAIDKGIAKEQARDLLPEGLTTTRLYMNGSLRSWIHFYQVRSDASAQYEIRLIANSCWDIIKGLYPNVHDALESTVE